MIQFFSFFFFFVGENVIKLNFNEARGNLAKCNVFWNDLLRVSSSSLNIYKRQNQPNCIEFMFLDASKSNKTQVINSKII